MGSKRVDYVQSGFPLNSGSQFREAPLQNPVLWEGMQRPNLNGDPSVTGSVESKLDHYVNAAAFSRPAPDTFGTMPRTISTYRSPALKNLDAAIFKNLHSPSKGIFNCAWKGSR